MAIIGNSKAVHRVHTSIKKLSRSRKNIVIIGESGVGKGVVAESIHERSKDATKPLVQVSLSALDEVRAKEMIKAIWESRQFRNPMASAHGDFRLPEGTTIVIEEIEKSSRTVQEAMCELLEKAKKQRLGYRFVFLLRNGLPDLFDEKKILDCLFTHLKQFEKIEIPPLRKRREDIPDLVEHFIQETAQKMGISDPIIDPNTLDVLVQQEWKGNVRELKERISQSILTSTDRQEFRLPEEMISEESELQRVLEKIEAGVEFAIDNSMQLIERRILERVLSKFNYNQSRAARFLHITEDTLRYRMKKLGISTVKG